MRIDLDPSRPTEEEDLPEQDTSFYSDKDESHSDSNTDDQVACLEAMIHDDKETLVYALKSSSN
jgi:hypothetical protein